MPTRIILSTALIVCVALVASCHSAYAEPISPRRLVEIADFSPPAVSPDETRVAFRLQQAAIERNAYDTAWYVQSMDGASPPVRVADGGIPLRSSSGAVVPAPTAAWSPDGRWIYFRALVGGRIDVWRAAVDGSGAEPLTLDAADVRDFLLSADGAVLKYSVGATREEVFAAEEAEYNSGIRIDERVPIGQGLFRSGNINGRLETQRFTRGELWERAALLADVPDRWKAVDLHARTVRTLPSSEQPPMPLGASDLAAAVGQPSLVVADTRSGRIALLKQMDDADLPGRGHVQLSMLPHARARQPVVCTAEQCSDRAIRGIQWRPSSDEVLFTVSDPQRGFAQSIHRWNVLTGEVHTVVHADGLLNGGRFRDAKCGVSTKAIACIADDASGPPRLERIEIATGQRIVLFEPNKALATDMAALSPQLLRWTDTLGQEFTGWLFPALEADGAPPPLFVTYYACSGFMRGGVGDQWPLPSFAGYGISALCINGLPHRDDAIARYDEGLSAVQSVVELLASSGRIDPARVGMGELSFGSEVSIWVATESDLLSAVSVTSPVISPLYHVFGSLKGESFTTGLRSYWQLGAPDETPEQWERLSPTSKLDRFRAPVLMQMPEQEYIYALDYAIPLIRAARADLYVFPHEPHVMHQPRHLLAANERNLDWFRFWLQSVEDDDPRKTAQYEHWRRMRAAAQ
ncbi:Atxe2 family lasso peptide isopeptidase [Luteimonas sp. BDR2-5]|uniref:Atxe2 family lasso peptide isopeptidase n=1 Tax=Proluteimonas luteida TaxID=2878685 RepID=UPI001E62325C|nr:Atxe2 family lasso peptide isopeptidase [Luteimonas sp. BDR2-5]MCD9026729.1 Atxe2 family lasso peptide isopeptidase [Luteimonas sp. BDR2-5]